MLPDNATSEEFHAFIKLINKPFMESLSIDCVECLTLVTGLLAGNYLTAEACEHIHQCEITQARLNHDSNATER